MPHSSARQPPNASLDDDVSGATAGRPTSAARSRLSQIMTVLDTNLLGTVHGGVVMKLVDDVAGVVAQRHSGGAAVTASMDEMDFVSPVRVATAYLGFVAVDGDGRPRAVTPVLPENDEDRRRFAEADIRRTHRLARRAAIARSRDVGPGADSAGTSGSAGASGTAERGGG